MFPAFKEWRVIVEALGAGEQALILRKGGIAEGRSGFQVAAPRFWLFPTEFHAQREKTKPAAARWFDWVSTHTSASTETAAKQAADEIEAVADDEKTHSVPLRYFAEIVQHAFLADWAAVTALDRFHLWTEATIRDRFTWSKPPGLHALLVRVHRLDTPIALALTPAAAGCKSWIETALPFDSRPSSPVLSETAFRRIREEIGLDRTQAR